VGFGFSGAGTKVLSVGGCKRAEPGCGMVVTFSVTGDTGGGGASGGAGVGLPATGGWAKGGGWIGGGGGGTGGCVPAADSVLRELSAATTVGGSSLSTFGITVSVSGSGFEFALLFATVFSRSVFSAGGGGGGGGPPALLPAGVPGGSGK
jgi:hypothetical protein